MTSSAVRLCRLEELPEGESRGFDPLGKGYDTMLVVRRGNRLHAWRDACPHMSGAPMAWRKDEYLNAGRDRIMCSSHGAQFDIVTGICIVGPCVGQALKPLHLTVRGGTLFVDVGPGRKDGRGENLRPQSASGDGRT
jgi:nitrite reductase/ring-hydroxylating ferredoxin subunit